MQISEQIIYVIDELAKRFGMVVDWTQQNVMPTVYEVCGRYIRWEIAESIFYIIIIGGLLALLGFISLKCSRWFHNTYKNDHDYEGIGRALFMLLAIFLWIGSFGAIAYNIYIILKCALFPEMMIYEFISKLI